MKKLTIPIKEDDEPEGETPEPPKIQEYSYIEVRVITCHLHWKKVCNIELIGFLFLCLSRKSSNRLKRRQSFTLFSGFESLKQSTSVASWCILSESHYFQSVSFVRNFRFQPINHLYFSTYWKFRRNVGYVGTIHRWDNARLIHTWAIVVVWKYNETASRSPNACASNTREKRNRNEDGSRRIGR